MLTAEGLKAQAAEIGFDLCGIAPAEGFPELAPAARLARPRLRGPDGLPSAHGPSARGRAPDPAFRPFGDRLRHAVPHRTPAVDRVGGCRRGHRRALCLGRRLPRRDRRAPRNAPGVDARAAPRAVRGAGLRRHRARPGAGVRPVRGPRLGGEERLPDQPRSRLLAVPLGDHLQPPAPRRRARHWTNAAPARCASRRAPRARWSSRASWTPHAACLT